MAKKGLHRSKSIAQKFIMKPEECEEGGDCVSRSVWGGRGMEGGREGEGEREREREREREERER